MESTQISSQLVDGTLVYARGNDKKRVIDLVLSDDCNNRNITPICVIADSGIGKTTLVQLVYADRRTCNVFDMRAFIQMTEGSDVKSLMKQIVESLTSVPCNITEPSMVERIVMDELMNKKVLIILDGAENENREFWMNVLTLLSAAGKGSVVLLTTNRQEVASEINAVHYYKLDCLSDEICWLIFQQKAFQGQSVIHPTFEKVGKELIVTCANNTLGVNLLGGFLCHSTTEEQWMKLWRSLSKSNSWNRDSMGGTALIITECYKCLPTYLQRCLDYCSLFPKNLVFLRNQVVHLWLAQGFIEPMIGRELEDTGFEYFDELYNRSFFQCSPLYDAKMPSFQMHELIHAFLQEKSQDIFFRYENNLQSIPHSIHHLSLISSGYHTVQIDCLVAQARNFQSFLVINRLMPQLYHPYLASLNLAGLNDLILNSKNLRALDLSNTGIKELPNSISSLSMLQYFSLSNTNIKSIPSQIGDLLSLRYFEARNCYHLVDLPESINSLMELRHLDVSKKAGFVGMPVRIGELTNLRSLVTFNVGSDELHSGIKELKNLVYLRGCLVISGLENVKSALDAKQAQLKNKASIESLTLQWTNNMEYSENDIDAELQEKVLENLQPSANLTELIVKNYPGRKFSLWIGNPSYSRLISIIIDGCPDCRQLPALGALPSLKHLSVQKLYGIENMELLKFPSLESMKIWEMYNLKELFIIEKGALPHLHSLSISKCPLLRSIPCFTSLLELSIHYCSQLPQISDLPSLQCLNIEGFPKIKHLILPQGLSGLNKLEISFCNELSSLDNLSKLTSIKELKIYQCPKLNTCDWKPNYLVRNEESRNYRQEDTKGGHVYKGDKTRTDPGNPLTPIRTQTQSNPRNPLDQIQTHIRPNLTISESQTDPILTNPIRPNLKSSSIQSKPNQSEIQKTSISKLTQSSSPTLPIPNSTQYLPEGQTSLIQSDLNLTRLPPLHVYIEENTMANASIIGALIVLESALTNELATLATSRTPEFLSMLSVLDTSMNNIFSELRVMQAFIEQTELTAHRNKVELVWLGEVQKVANQVKETVDEFVNSVDNEQYGGIWLYVQRIFKDRKSLVNLRRVASKLQAIESKLEHLAKLKDRWVPTSNVGLVMNSNRSNEYAQHLAVSAHFIDEKNIVGIEENREVLSRWLNSGETHLCVISVWGMGGVGKTTLVANVFKRERKNFDCHAWISLSESYTTENILRNIISEIFRDNHSLPIDTSNMNVRCLKEYLLGVLKDMKYLIVLDDIWNPKSVLDISDILIDNHKNSRIVITSRIADVANLAPESNRLELKPLSKNESWDLFCRKAFHLENNHECPSPLEQWAREIVFKCDGLPLALVSLGGLLSLVDKTDTEWRRVYDQLSWELENNPTLDSLKNILILSFKYLPIYLKQCLLYCCLFPEDSMLARKKLVRLWIAEGFIEQKGRSTLEEVAEGYFNELIHRSMLQVVAKNPSDRAKRCRMHHTLRELAISLCSKENFGLLHDDNKKVSFKDIIRRLSVVKQSEEINQNVNLTYLGTFMSVDPTVPSSSVFSLIFNKSRYLVVLNLEGLPIETIPDTIGNLFNLRYLGLRGTKVKLLPKSIDKLSNLQTLDLMRSNIQKLPDGIAELKRLRHLFAQVLLDPTYRTFQSLAGVTLPKGIFYLKELQTVQALESNALTMRELGNLTQLRSFKILNVKENHSAELCRSLSNMRSLSNLSIFASNENFYLELEDLKSLPQLQKLCLHGRLKEYMLRSLLYRICSMGSIQMLNLGWSQLKADPLPSLSHLGNLAWLTLQKAYEGKKLHFKAEWFPKLKHLSLRQMPNLVQMEMEQGTMVNLDTIHLLELEQLKDIPEGIKHLTNLRWMVCKYMPAGFADLPSGIHQLHHFRCQVL